MKNFNYADGALIVLVVLMTIVARVNQGVMVYFACALLGMVVGKLLYQAKPVRRLPPSEHFILYFDDEGDFVIEARRQHLKQHLGAHGRTPNEAVDMMAEVLDLVEEDEREQYELKNSKE